MSTVLITGGAGFIGSALARRLLDAGHEVVAMDNLHPQVHSAWGRPGALPDGVTLLTGDVTHAPDWAAVLRLVRPAQVVHLAAETGTGQSLSQATRHGLVNVVGTTQLLDALTQAAHVPEQIVLASSRAVYGEGGWELDGKLYNPGPRRAGDLAAGRWDPPGPGGRVGVSVPSEAGSTVPNPTSVYGATKLAQEHVLRAWSAARECGLTVLRLQNAYGPGQSLTNPYTGIVSLFGRLGKSGQALPVYEDGEIVRDFVFIDDVTSALARAVAQPVPRPRLVDIGSGQPTTLLRLARLIAQQCDAPAPQIVGKFREGDVRAASCSVAHAEAELGWRAEWPLTRGIPALLEWIAQRPEPPV